jgi:hypothetical protein
MALAAHAGAEAQGYKAKNVMGALAGIPEFSMFLRSVEYAGLVDLFNRSDFSGTVFVPVNLVSPWHRRHHHHRYLYTHACTWHAAPVMGLHSAGCRCENRGE